MANCYRNLAAERLRSRATNSSATPFSGESHTGISKRRSVAKCGAEHRDRIQQEHAGCECVARQPGVRASPLSVEVLNPLYLAPNPGGAGSVSRAIETAALSRKIGRRAGCGGRTLRIAAEMSRSSEVIHRLGRHPGCRRRRRGLLIRRFRVRLAARAPTGCADSARSTTKELRLRLRQART